MFKLKSPFPALRSGHESVAVLVRENTDLARVRNYLVSNNMRPRQLGGPEDFEEARHDIEQLPLLTDAHSVALTPTSAYWRSCPQYPKPSPTSSSGGSSPKAPGTPAPSPRPRRC